MNGSQPHRVGDLGVAVSGVDFVPAQDCLSPGDLADDGLGPDEPRPCGGEGRRGIPEEPVSGRLASMADFSGRLGLVGVSGGVDGLVGALPSPRWGAPTRDIDSGAASAVASGAVSALAIWPL